MSGARDRILTTLDSMLMRVEWAEVTLEQVAAEAGTKTATITDEFGSRVGLAVAYVVHWLDAITVLDRPHADDGTLSPAAVRELVEPALLLARRRIRRLAKLIGDTHPGVSVDTALAFLDSLVRESAANVLVRSRCEPAPSRRFNDYLTMLVAG